MGRYASDPGGGDFERPEPGTYGARCYRIIDLGTQHSERWNTDKEQVMVGWELVGTTMSDGRPFAMHKTYTQSLHEKASLRKDLEAWRGRPFTDAELKGFDLLNVLNAPCLLSVIHRERDGKTYANVGGVMSVPKGQQVAALANGTQSFFLDEPDWDVFRELSERVQKRIMASPEYQRAWGDREDDNGHELPPADDGPPPMDDSDLPF